MLILVQEENKEKNFVENVKVNTHKMEDHLFLFTEIVNMYY